MLEKFGLSVIHDNDLQFAEKHLSMLKVPYGVFEKEVLIAGGVFTLIEIKKSFEEILKLSSDAEVLKHLVAELAEYIQSIHSTENSEKLATKLIRSYLHEIKVPVQQSILLPIERLLASIPVDNKSLIDWLNRANHLFKVVEDEQGALLKYMARFNISLKDIKSGEIVTNKVSLEMIVTAFSAYLKEASLYARANSQNIEIWRQGLLERQKANPEILRMIIEKGSNKLVFYSQLMTFAVAVIFVLVGIYADDIFDSASAKDKVIELNVRNGLLTQRIEDLSKSVEDLKLQVSLNKKPSPKK